MDDSEVHFRWRGEACDRGAMVRLAVILSQQDAVDEADSWYRQAAGAALRTRPAVERPEARVARAITTDAQNATHGSGSRAREAGAHGVDAGVPGRGPTEPKPVVGRESRFQCVEFIDQCVQPLRPLR